MKRLGKLDLARHFIGERKPIVAFLGISVLSLNGCDSNGQDYTLYTTSTLSDCVNNNDVESCKTSYQQAELEAKRTAIKYQSERSCSAIYGDICFQNEDFWQPRFAGFVMHNNSDFAMPVFTSINPDFAYYGDAFTADGFRLGRLSELDGESLNLPEKYTQPLPSGQPEQLIATSQNNPDNTTNNDNTIGNSTRRGSIVSDLATAYLVSNAINKTGDYLTERERTKRYNQCMDKGGSNCYNTYSGTARIGGNKTNSHTYNSSTTYSSSTADKKKTTSWHKSSPTVKTVSKGGFGSTGSIRGGFGG